MVGGYGELFGGYTNFKEFSDLADQSRQADKLQSESKDLILNAYKQQTSAYGEVNEAYKKLNSTSSMDDINSFLQKQNENFKLLSNEQIEEIRNNFNNNFGDSIANNLLDGVDTTDEDAVSAVREGKYLPNRVNENILDSYATPNYHLRLFMMERNWVNSMRTQEVPDEKSSIKYEIELPEEAEKIVVIAETSATDITIDNMDIEHFLSEPVKGKTTSVGTSVGFTLTEPGSVSLLDRLAAAKAYLGYTNTGSFEPSNQNQEAVITGGGLVPFYLEVTFKGYPDDPSGDETNGKADPEQIGRKFIYELAYLKFDMDIQPQGTTYNCTAHIGQDVARFPEYTLLKEEIVIEGDSISSLLFSLQNRLNSVQNDLVSEGNPAKTEFRINYNNIFRPEVAKEDPETGEQFDKHGNLITYKDTLDYIGDKLFIDPEKVTPVEKANTPEWYSSHVGAYGDASFQSNDAPTVYTNYGTINLDPPGSLNSSPISAVATDFSTEKYKEGANKQKFKTILEEPGRVRINIPQGRSVYDAVNSIMSLCYDLMSKATRLVDFEDPSKGVNTDQTYVYWYDIEHFINTDLSDSAYDPLNNNYKSKIEYSVTLIKNARADIGISANELSMSLSAEDITSRLNELKISKEYLYMFTGLNDQIINMDLKFDEAYVLSVPFYGMGNPQEQLAYALSGDLTLDEANKSDNVLLNSPSDKATEQQQKDNILKFINDLKDDAGELKAEASGLTEQLANPNTGMFGREFLETALTNKGSKEEADLVEAIRKSDSLRQAVNAQLTKNRISANANSPTSSDSSDDPDGENPKPENEENIEETAREIPVWSSQLVPGLEGPGDDPRIARAFGSILDEKINSYTSSTTLKTADVITTKTSTNRQFITQPVERGSVRQTAFAHLMHQHSGAVSTQRINIDVRGDPWYWGKGNFLKADAEGVSEYKNDLDGCYYDSGGPNILLMIEAPRKLDFDTSDEDADINTGMYNMGHLNYTMSGVYLVTNVSSNLSDGVFTTSLSLTRNSNYEVSKLERVKEIIADRIQEELDNIDNQEGGAVNQAKEAVESNFENYNETFDSNITPNFYSND